MTAHTPEEEREEKQWTDALGTAPKRDFVYRVFACSSAMVKKKPENGQRTWTQYDPAIFSKEQYDLVEGMWDHEHCAICDLRIQEGGPYWANSENHILCPACYEKFRNRG